MLPPARQSATSGVNMRSTLGKSLLREEVHEHYIENYIENGQVGGPVSQRDGLLLLRRGSDDKNNNKKKKSIRTYPYGPEGFFAAGSAFPLETEIMTKCMQWKDRIANRCPIGLTPPGVMKCVCVCVYLCRPFLSLIYLLYLHFTFCHTTDLGSAL